MAGRPRAGEFELIARCFRPLAAGTRGALELLDDAAVLPVDGGEALVATCDTLVAGVHFPVGTEAGLVGRRLLRVNLSDLAAMGAAPWAYLVAAALGADEDDAWADAFAAGLAADQAAFGLALAGGDTVATPGPLTLSLTALGRVPEGEALRRDGARAGDRVFVSGTVGDGALGLRALQGRLAGPGETERAALVDRYRLPRPRLELGRRLRGLAHAAIDVSDGLVADLGHVCAASGVAAVIDWDSVPLSPPARAALAADPALRGTVLGGGDDYELVFTAAAGEEGRIEDAARAAGVAVSAIGRVEAGRGVAVVDSAGGEIPVAEAGYRHF